MTVGEMTDDPLQGAHVLVVEDNALNRKLFNDLLEAQGAAPACFGEVKPALAALAAQAFDLVLVNAKLPDGDCYEMLDAVSAGDAPAPVFVLTTSMRGYPREEWLAAGAAGCIEKPITAMAFLERLRETLSGEDEE